MKLLIDTNVVLDLLLKRQDFYADATKLFELIENATVEGFVSASAITDIFYIANRNLHDKERAIQIIKELLQIITVLAVSEAEIENALNSDWRDFEESVQFYVAVSNEIDFIITRNPADYDKSSIATKTPTEFLETFN